MATRTLGKPDFEERGDSTLKKTNDSISTELLEQILQQIKLTNFMLSEISGLTATSEDFDDIQD